MEQVTSGGDYHSNCLVRLFGSEEIPVLEYNLDELAELAKRTVRQKVTVPGVQAKLSMEMERQSGEADKLTITGLGGRYILKPPSQTWPELPENEHCTMRMAALVGLECVPHGLIRLASGERAYITRRIDRGAQGEKYAMEDMCQLSGRLTEDKYKGSHEQVAWAIKNYSVNPMFDLTRYFEVVLFSYLTGNSDMHLKNFSLFKDPELGWKLAPAYDLLSTWLVIPEEKDPEELALSLSGKKSNFNRSSFELFGLQIGLNRKQISNSFEHFISLREELNKSVDHSFLSEEVRRRYRELLDRRYGAFESQPV
ncbi:MAG: HipA domain-containing protein [Balneolaceae bacterium]|nr:HipA domain-containing protein [Balneolaceae bacterium]